MALTQNTNLITTSKITKEALYQLVNNLVIGNRIDWSHSKEFGNKTAQIGDTLGIRRAVLASVQEDNMVWTGNLPYEGKVSLTIDKTMTVPLSFSDADLALRIEEFSSRFIKQAVVSLANAFDRYVYGKVLTNAYWTVGNYGTAITSDTILAAKEILDSMNCPDDGEIYGVLTAKHSHNLSNAQLTLFNAQKEISEIYRKGRIGMFAGIEFAVSNSSPSHADGTIWASTPGVTTLSAADNSTYLTTGWAESSTLRITGATAGKTINSGDVFTLSGANGPVYAFNPLTKAQLPIVQQFVALSSATTTSSFGLTVSPAIIAGGDYQNVVDPTGSLNVIGYVSSSASVGQESVIFHRKAIVAVSPDLYVPGGVDQSWRETSDETGLSIRYMRVMDAINARLITRLDSLGGVKVARGEHIVRIR